MLAYSTTSNYECIISELMKCSLLDIFKAHMVQGTRMSRKNQIVYATQLALGMNYLHTCNPPIIHRDVSLHCSSWYKIQPRESEPVIRYLTDINRFSFSTSTAQASKFVD